MTARRKKRKDSDCKRRTYKTQHQAVQAARAKDDESSPIYCDTCKGWHIERWSNKRPVA